MDMNGLKPAEIIAALFNYASDQISERKGKPARAQYLSHAKPSDTAIVATAQEGAFSVESLHSLPLGVTFNNCTMNCDAFDSRYGRGSAYAALSYIQGVNTEKALIEECNYD